MILCLGTTPAAQRVMTFRSLAIDHVNRAVTTLDGVAGKSINVVKVLQALGELPVATGFLGGDRGEEARAVLDARGIEHEFVTVATRTRLCITVIDESNSTQTELVEESRAVEAAAHERLLEIVRRRVTGCRAMVLSGTLTPGAQEDLYGRCVDMARAAGVMTVVDAKGKPLEHALKAGPDVVKPNRAELEASLGRELTSETDVMAAARQLVEQGARRVVVTVGKAPALAFDGQTFWRIAPPRITVVNPIGSGDAFTAAMVSRMMRGDDFGEACRWGSAAGAANALTLMPGDLDLEHLERLVPEVTIDRI